MQLSIFRLSWLLHMKIKFDQCVCVCVCVSVCVCVYVCVRVCVWKAMFSHYISILIELFLL